VVCRLLADALLNRRVHKSQHRHTNQRGENDQNWVVTDPPMDTCYHIELVTKLALAIDTEVIHATFSASRL
jgi:hypothetical protein